MFFPTSKETVLSNSDNCEQEVGGEAILLCNFEYSPNHFYFPHLKKKNGCNDTCPTFFKSTFLVI